MTRLGHYPIERRAGEIERLRLQSDALEFDAAVMFDRIGPLEGWSCLDLACGAGGVTNLLSARVGAAGSVVGLDADPAMIDASRRWADDSGLVNVEYVEGDAYGTGLAAASFDLVHARFIFSTGGEIDRLMAEAMRLLKPDGVLAIQEPDIETLKCYPPHPAWETLVRALGDVFAAIGGDVRLAQRLYRLVRAAGLQDVHYRPFLIGVTYRDPMVEYLPQTIESVRKVLLERCVIAEAELDQALAAVRHHLADPDTVFTSYLVAQVWGRKPV